MNYKSVKSCVISALLCMSFISIGSADESIEGYRWDAGGPKVLRTSQVYGSNSQSCGEQNYEVCIGTATKEGSTKLIKCYIPRNSVICPTQPTAKEQCQVANETTNEAQKGVIPACSRRHPDRDNTSRGCTCEGLVYRGERIIKKNYSECMTLRRQRIAAQRAREAAARRREAARCAPTASPRPSDCPRLPTAACPDGQVTNSNNECVSPASGVCNDGLVWHTGDGTCVPPTAGVCQQYYQWDIARGACVPLQVAERTCSAGQVTNSQGQCVPAASGVCNDGLIWHNGDGTCVPPTAGVCQQEGRVWDSARGACVVAASAPAPTVPEPEPDPSPVPLPTSSTTADSAPTPDWPSDYTSHAAVCLPPEPIPAGVQECRIN